MAKQTDWQEVGAVSRQKIWILVIVLLIIPIVAGSCRKSVETAAPDTPVYKIADFENVLDLRRWAIAGIAELSREKCKSGNYSLKVKFFQEEWPGIVTSSIPKDISNYRVLKFDVFSTSNSKLNLWVRMDDLTSVNSPDFKNRYNSLHELNEGWNSIGIQLKGLKSSGGMREMDLRKIQKFAIFLARPDRDVVLYFDGIRLEK